MECEVFLRGSEIASLQVLRFTSESTLEGRRRHRGQERPHGLGRAAQGRGLCVADLTANSHLQPPQHPLQEIRFRPPRDGRR